MRYRLGRSGGARPDSLSPGSRVGGSGTKPECSLFPTDRCLSYVPIADSGFRYRGREAASSRIQGVESESDKKKMLKSRGESQDVVENKGQEK